jgi:hypothetical protein
MNEASQNAAVLNHMKTVGPITSIQAIHEFGCTRLSARIAELEALGFEIDKEWKKDPLTGKRWKEYRLR